MKKLFSVIAASLALNASAFAGPKNVILITIDGVRPQDFFGKPDPELASKSEPDALMMSRFWNSYGASALTFSKMTVANKANISLPGYASIFAGKETECVTNECERTKTETFPEVLVRAGKVQKSKVAGFGSWEKLPLAFEHVSGATTTNMGFKELTENVCTESKDRVAELNRRQAVERPNWKENRYDRFTWNLALEYLKCNKPRFLYIGINDTDDHGHNGNYAGYLNALRVFDGWVVSLLDDLKAMGQYGKDTTVILTTDHSRGLGEDWKHHGTKIKGSNATWMVVLNLPSDKRSLLPDAEAEGLTHTAIRKVVDGVLDLPSPEKRIAAKAEHASD